MNFNKSGIVMASIGNINRGIYLIIDVVDYKMWPKPQKACLLGLLEDGCHHFTTPRVFQAKERQIVLNVAKYFQEESKSGNKPQFRAGAVIAKTAAATGVSKNSVRKIVRKIVRKGTIWKAG